MIVLIDNYDSFVHNLARYFERLGQPTLVVRNDATSAEAIARLRPAAVVVSPGPRAPADAGCSLDVVRHLAGATPILGICLGHQVIAAAFDSPIVRAAEPVHGRASHVFHSGQGIFAGLANPLLAGRYHSLVVDRAGLAPCFDVTAWTGDGTIMAIEHRHYPIVGLQFHPESILTRCGYQVLAGFLRLAELATPRVPLFETESTAELAS